MNRLPASPASLVALPAAPCAIRSHPCKIAQKRVQYQMACGTRARLHQPKGRGHHGSITTSTPARSIVFRLFDHRIFGQHGHVVAADIAQQPHQVDCESHHPADFSPAGSTYSPRGHVSALVLVRLLGIDLRAKPVPGGFATQLVGVRSTCIGVGPPRFL